MTEYHQAAGNEETAATGNDEAGAGDGAEKENGGIMAPFKWFMASPFTRYPFAIFLLFGAATFIWLILFLTSSTTGFIMAGCCAIVMSLYGANHFRILLKLKEQVDKMAHLNDEFRSENAALKTEVDKLGKAREQLTDVEAGLRESNKKLKENVEKFKQLDENLKKLSDSNIEGLEKLQESSKQVMSSMKESLVRHEKEILNKVFDHLEYKDDKDGLNEQEYEEFLHALPEAYQLRFRNKGVSFAQLAGDDGILDYQEFCAMVDAFAEAEATETERS